MNHPQQNKTQVKNQSKQTVVVFADDQPLWHQQIDNTKEKALSKFKNLLTNCVIRSAYNANELFSILSQLVQDQSIEHILLFLDLSFPTKKEGLETLNRISRNKNQKIRQIPVFVYSISDDPSDINAAYSRLSQGFFHKSDHPYTFWEALENIDGSAGYKLPRIDNLDVDGADQPKNDVPTSYQLREI